MNEIRLRITGPTGQREIVLDGSEMVMGRGDDCDIVLDHSNVSRRHAKISRDAFGRWIVEDLGSRNGVVLAGQSITTQAVFPRETFHIRPFTLGIIEADDEQSHPDTTLMVVDVATDGDVVPYRPIDQDLSPAMVANLNEFTDALLKLTSPTELYSQACWKLSAMFNALTAVVRLPAGSVPIPQSPEIVACHFGAAEGGSAVHAGFAVHLSRRVLEAARSTDTPVKAAGAPGERTDIGLTIVDEHKPHIVFAARISEMGETIDALYIDVERSRAPEGMFDFIEAIARQINFAQKNLLLGEVQKQQEALRKANEELLEKDRIKDEYVSRVTHDIKGHLAAIQSCLFVVSSDKSVSLAERQCDFLGRAERRAVQVADFVKELLELTQMRLSGKFEVAPFSLAEVIEKSLTAVARGAGDKSIEVTGDVDAEVALITGNEFSITEMISNLLFNAVKYTPENRTVHLQASKRGDHIQIDISDTGIGIPAEDVEHVFDEFFRAGNAKSREKDGTGLGLSIVKQIVDRHHGTISVESELDKGTTFTVILPISGPKGGISDR